MRHLILHRQRALACFAMKYCCILNRDREAFLRSPEGQDPLALLGSGIGPVLRNGETVSIDIGDGGCTFFVAACLDGRNLVTDEVVIPPGTEDAAYVIRTDYDGYKRLSICVVPAGDG